MKDLTNPPWIKAKGILFLLVGMLAAGLLLLERHDAKTIFVPALSIRSCRRFSCFAFYIIRA